MMADGALLNAMPTMPFAATGSAEFPAPTMMALCDADKCDAVIGHAR
jgi:hypothetical protein